MGLQDRDYYREKNKGAHQSPRLMVRKSGKNSTGIKYLLYPLITIAALWYGADTLLNKINVITLIPAPVVCLLYRLGNQGKIARVLNICYILLLQLPRFGTERTPF